MYITDDQTFESIINICINVLDHFGDVLPHTIIFNFILQTIS